MTLRGTASWTMLWGGVGGGIDCGDVCRRGRGASSKKGQAGDYSQAWSFRSCDPAGPESLGRSGSRAVFADWVDSAGGEGYGGWAECYLINAVWIVDCRGITGQTGGTWDGRNPMGTWVCRRSRTGLRSTGPPAQVGWSGCLSGYLGGQEEPTTPRSCICAQVFWLGQWHCLIAY